MAFIAALLMSVVLAFGGIGAPVVQWNGAADREVAVEIGFIDNTTRKNASGDKITSNAHSKDFPGIYFIWDSKQKDNGYLKVAGWMFEGVEGTDFYGFEFFTLTSKESNKYFDFEIRVQEGQQKTVDGGYVFFIPKVYNNKNINMVFFDADGYALNQGPVGPVVPIDVEYNVGFIGYYDFNGLVLQTSFYWQTVKTGEAINWDAVEAAYADWVARGGYGLDGFKGWQTSGGSSQFFSERAPYLILTQDLKEAFTESYYKAVYFDPGYITRGEAAKRIEYLRYRAYVQLWNDLYLDSAVSAANKTVLFNEGGIAHYNALLAAYGASSLPPYFAFADYNFGEEAWADWLEVGLLQVYSGDLVQWVIDFGDFDSLI
ncbi:MAG: hypothetical protein FWE53_03255 [Firmicutes bacterium]|nr:hypothetical protein [Bacillota bacterium]